MYDIPILMLHSVNDRPEMSPMGALSVSSKGLASYLKVFSKWHYQMISMDDLLRGNYNEDKPYVVLTFDDGYKDNLSVALPVLKEYGAKATIFVNPSYVSEESDPHSEWGFMTWDEVALAAESGVFDIQSHTMTHEFIFASDKVVDFYTPEKFHKYYWLAWMLYPDSPKKWDSTAMKYKDLIPTGYPVFEYTRRLSAKKFTPDNDYVSFLIDRYAEGKTKEAAEAYIGNKGTYEDDAAFTDYAVWEIVESKKELEQRLQKEIHTLCFPGGGYTDEVLSIAQNAGYKCFMNARRLRNGNNNDHMALLKKGEFVGLNRTSFSLIHPGILPDHFFDYHVAKLSLGTYQKQMPYTFFKKILSKILHA